MTTASVVGIHHVAFVVEDLDSRLAWFSAVFGAEHLARFDHSDQSGQRSAVVLRVPGLDPLLQLRSPAGEFDVMRDCAPVTFMVADVSALESWVAHLERLGVSHGGVAKRRTGMALDVQTPDGATLRFYTAPEGGFDTVTFSENGISQR